jgi:hypothetical protein
MKHRSDLFSIDTNAKTVKGQAQGFMTGVMYLAPAKQAGVQVCAMAARAECEAPCLFTAGRGAFNAVQQARINKTRQFLYEREWFMESVACSVSTLLRKADKAGLTPVVRLNGTSDIPWEKFRVRGKRNIMQVFPDVQFYDYTKVAARFATCHEDNYDLTFSWSASAAFAEQVRLARAFTGNRAMEDLRGLDASSPYDSLAEALLDSVGRKVGSVIESGSEEAPSAPPPDLVEEAPAPPPPKAAAER